MCEGNSLHVVSLFLIKASWIQRNATAVAMYQPADVLKYAGNM